MRNIMISDKEREAFNKVVEAFDEFIGTHENVEFEQVIKATKVEKVHFLLYMNFAKDLVGTISALKGIFEDDEERFIEVVTNNGEKSLDEVEKMILISTALGSIAEKES